MNQPANLSLPPAPAARRLGQPRWRRGRVTLGAALVITAVVGGAALLRGADASSTVLTAARDLPSGVPLGEDDLQPVQVRLPEAQLAVYARPGTGADGARLTTGLPAGALVPAAWLVEAGVPADLIDYPVPVDPRDVPVLRPGDRATVVASYPDAVTGTSGRSEILLPSAEVVRLLHDPGGLGTAARVQAVQVRLPKDRLAAVAQAVATGRISMARLTSGDAAGVPADDAPTGAAREPRP